MWIWLGLLGLGIALGEGIWIFLERRERKRELEEISKALEDLLYDRRPKLRTCQESLLSKIFHQIGRLQERNQNRQERILEDRDSIKKLIGEIAHQLRTPLTNLETYLEFLKEETKEQEREEYLEAASFSRERLSFLAEGFIKMSRLEQRLIQIRREETDLAVTLRQALKQARPKAEERGIRLLEKLPEELKLEHDGNWLGEAVFNLLDNGIKYTQTGGRVLLGAEKNEMFVRIWVRDNGAGIRGEEESRLFQRFYRGKNAGSKEGFGLGLYIAREIVLLHKGFLRLREQERGTLAEICLPVNWGKEESA